MDILQFHQDLIDNYGDYIRSFIHIKDTDIESFVEDELGQQKLWPSPLIQFNPTYQQGMDLKDLASQIGLHQDLTDIFSGYHLYRHQEEAITLGAHGREFIVTSGTGSGKSLTYLATIFNHILSQEVPIKGEVRAVIVYPMNALINSQYKEIEKFALNYQARTGKDFPIRFAQYTGQEDEEIRERIRKDPPHILLTNYMMLELLMTRGGRDVPLRNNFLSHLRYLVFDELHTYRGRQGSDVSMLIRRIRASANQQLLCIGTSATMVSGDTSTLEEQKQEVAKVGSTIFGTTLQADQVINEYLVRSLDASKPIQGYELKNAIRRGVDSQADKEEFKIHPTALWLENEVALELREGVLLRRKPMHFRQIARVLAEKAEVPETEAREHLVSLLEWANQINTTVGGRDGYLPFRVHQFIAQTGSVYATLEPPGRRALKLEAGLYAEDADTKLYPLVFSRHSGHEFYCVRLLHEKGIIVPRDFHDTADLEDDEVDQENGYLVFNHAGEDDLWDFERDSDLFPDTWFNKPKKDGTRTLRKGILQRLPRQIYFNHKGQFSFEGPGDQRGWFIPSPLYIDPSSGRIYSSPYEWSKFTKLGGEGRSTATTVLSFETLQLLRQYGQPAAIQKLLSFTDNRQDASLQAGHFNDFVRVGQLRASIVKALKTEEKKYLDFAEIGTATIKALGVPQTVYARNPSDFPAQTQENEELFNHYITYRCLEDLRRGWRVVMPNLEQCALLEIQYKFLKESCLNDGLWQVNPILRVLNPEDREQFLNQILDFFRKNYALHYSLLEKAALEVNTKRFKEKLKSPWTLDTGEMLEAPNHLALEKLGDVSRNVPVISASRNTGIGRFIRDYAKSGGLGELDANSYLEVAYDLMNLLVNGGWLHAKPVRSQENKEIFVYQLNVDKILWCPGDEETIRPDRIRIRTIKNLEERPNHYFQHFYKLDFQAMKFLEGREHTGQIGNELRKEREERFRTGEIGTLFCSPTMELGIDIADLSIVHMRNVPPSPANYAQRGGRAGRSGQAALVMTYCSNFSAHDRHYFKAQEQMVAGSVTAPRLDLVNEDLLRAHLNATILAQLGLDSLNRSIADLIDIQDLDRLPLKPELIEVLKLTDSIKSIVEQIFRTILQHTYFRDLPYEKRPSWLNTTWIQRCIDDFPRSFNQALDRWRHLYRSAQRQIMEASRIIEKRVYANDNVKKREAHSALKLGENLRDLLLNELTGKFRSRSSDQSEFAPFRYLASEGLLPGYNFTRLPNRVIMESQNADVSSITRSRSIALREFGPRNVIYHDGAKFRVDRITLPEAQTNLEKAKISPHTGYILMKQQYGLNVDPITSEDLNAGMDKHIHTNLIEMPEARAYEIQRITCQEEERTRKGYDVRTYFHVDGDWKKVTRSALVRLSEEKLLRIYSIPAARLVHLNLRWRTNKDQGYALNLRTGYWQSKKNEEEQGQANEIQKVKLYATDTANALYIQPVSALELKGGSDGVITLMYALKQAIINYFQVEGGEIGTSIMGDEEHPNILIYEAAEGSLGVLGQIVENPTTFREVIQEAYRICFVVDDEEKSDDELVPATYEDLLNYYNQSDHLRIDRRYIRQALQQLQEADLDMDRSSDHPDYESQYQHLQTNRDPNSSTEDKFLKYLYTRGLRLPDEAQPDPPSIYVRPDFFYKPNIMVFCDGTPHDQPGVQEQDAIQREALKASGYQVLAWRYSQSLDEFVAERPDIFTKVK
ncbi:MAG: DEAD/DEAH box helicase [Chitinophagales bacterium]|nr:DEAD/DEAH box helicase [Chitinophagales bacterium]MCB9312582.1 DEAD/DEAH box helicase [Lewinellaceae bacterium]